jgi:hypothetical protein
MTARRIAIGVISVTVGHVLFYAVFVTGTVPLMGASP